MKAEILCVGTELLLGDIVNTNAAYIARELANLGIDVFYQSVVGDNNNRLEGSLELAFSRADIVVLTGGLGPTYDDLTKETVAQYFGADMEMDQASLQSITMFFNSIGKPMTENNKKQAIMPKGATIFPNKWGTAPGLAITDGKHTAVLLPGPPREMKPMFDNCVVPYLMKYSDKTLTSRSIRMFGIGESQVEDMLYDMMKNAKNPTIAPYAKTGEVMLRITAAADSREEGLKMIDPVIEDISGVLGEYIYGLDVENLQTALVEQLMAHRLKIAVAESCTGGLLSEQITQIPGSSDVFDCGICSYANEIKHKLLGVSEKTLAEQGAVSEQCAREMADGVRKLAGADIAISTTGIAGPGGGSAEKPVGTVYVGISSEKTNEVLKLDLGGRRSDNERNNIRFRTSQFAFDRALKIIKSWYK